jgi:zona occludens toxin
MAINAYTGLMGSGKSFEVVTSVILPALMNGRRVVTNIDGINSQLIREYLVDVKKADLAKIGVLVAVTNEDVCKDGFFPDETNPDALSLVLPGDLVAVDECWQFWGNEHKISDKHMRFFRMHRHYTDPVSGVTCDLALMIQDLGTLNRKIKAVVELTSRTVKLKTVGAPTSYRIELYEGNKTTKQAKIDTFVKKYDKDIFPLYKSYASGSGNEKAMDKRQNILTNPRIWWTAALCLVVMLAAGWNAWKFFHPKDKALESSAVSAAVQVDAAGQAVVIGSAVPVQAPQNDFSESYRYAGRYKANGEAWVVMVDSQGRLRVESPSVFHGAGISSVGTVDDKKVTSFSGSQAANSSILPVAAGPTK